MYQDWHNKPQHVIMAGKEYRFKSLQEYKWAQYLEMMRQIGAIDTWEYEPRRFEFKERHRTRNVYTPDFRVVESNYGITEICWHEVKVALTQKAVYKFKMMAADFPEETMVLVLNCGTKKARQVILKDNARKYINRILYAAPLFRQYGIKS